MTKALIWDIETSPMEVYSWGLYPKMLPHGNIKRDWYIICGAWKWHGQKKVHTAAVDPKDCLRFAREGGEAPDRAVVAALADAVREADFIIAHNGDAFDLKKLNARVIAYGLEPIPPVRSVDTLKELRKVAKFSSNRLDHIAGVLLEDGGKIKTDFSLWTRIMGGEKKALKEMLRYNRRDVTELERVYEYLRPYMKAHPNVNIGDPEASYVPKCPACGSKDLQKRGKARTQTMEYQRYQCKSCGSWSRDSRVTGGILKK